MKIPLRSYWNLLIDYLRPQWRRAVILAVLLLSGTGLALVSPQIMRRFIDAATGVSTDAHTGSTYLRNAALLFIGLAFVQQFVNVGASLLSADVGWTATNALRTDLVAHCLGLDMSFHNARTPGEMIERLDGDVTALTNFFSQFVIRIFGSGLLLIGVLVALYLEDWRVGAAFTLFAGLALFVLARLRNIAVPEWRKVRQTFAEMFGYLEEHLAGTEDIRALGARDYVLLGFFKLLRRVYKGQLRAGLMMNVMVNSSSLTFAVGNAVALGMGAFLHSRGRFSLGAAYMVSYYGGLLMGPIMQIVHQLQDLQQASAGLVRVKELLDTQPVVEAPNPEADADWAPRLAAASVKALGVTYDHVSFAYHDEIVTTDEEDEEETIASQPDEAAEDVAPEPLVLHDLYFHLQPGRVLGLLGRTGSGKTTLTRLAFRLWDPDEGAIRLTLSPHAPADVRDLPLSDLRASIGMVTQNIQLFNASVRDNLTFFDPTIPDERLTQVIADLGLGEWLEGLPQGLDTELESGGAGLSAGEQQLLAFTRIFLQDPGLVILDEASSRLDPATEALIDRAVEQLVRGRTAIIIAHRLGTVRRADEIMIMREGRIIEHGERAALAADPHSRFYHLLQTGMEEVLV